MNPPLLDRRREPAVIFAITLIGAALRFWDEPHLGLNHFDEGIYALAGLWIRSPKGLAGISPEVVAYAPPLFPWLVGLAYLFLGISDLSAILVSQAAGVLTIPAVAWLARRAFGPGAGAAAAALCAISGPHIAFSRMALTDATFLLCFVLALGFGARFLERPGVVRAVVFGLFVGLAQNAKYNGMLAGLIVAIAAVWGLIVPSSEGRKGAIKAIAFGLIAAGVAGLVYLPWYRFVQAQPGGYAALLRHHRGYLSGPSAWPEHWRLQMAQQVALSGRISTGLTWGAIAWSLAWLGGWIASGLPGRDRSERWAGMRLRVGLLVGLTILGCSPNSGYWVALLTLPWLLADRRPAVRVIAILWAVFAVLTPFYHPYARLWLPLQAAGWLVLAGVVADLGKVPAAWASGRAADGSSTRFPGRPRMWAVAVAALVGLGADVSVEPRGYPIGLPIDRSDGLRLGCSSIATMLQGYAGPTPPPPTRLHIVARPAVLFYMSQRTTVPILRHASLRDLGKISRTGGLRPGRRRDRRAGREHRHGVPHQPVRDADHVQFETRAYRRFADLGLSRPRSSDIIPADGESAFQREPLPGPPASLSRSTAMRVVPLVVFSSSRVRSSPITRDAPMPAVSLWPDPNFLGTITDLYQLTMMAGYAASGMAGKRATFELFVRRLPPGRSYLVFAGLEQAIGDLLNMAIGREQAEYLRGLTAFAHVDPSWFDRLPDLRFRGDVWAIREGTVAFPGETLLRIEAPLEEAQWAETFLIASLNYPTLVASKAVRIVEAAQGRSCVDFGARRGHGPHAGLLAARAAYLAGFDGTSHVEAARRLGIPPVGTMAHAWVQSFDTEKQAFETFARVFPDGTTLLVDTFDTLNGVRLAAEIEPPVRGVRIDSGDVGSLARQARAILDGMGREATRIFASGDLDEWKIAELVGQGAPIDAFGVGTELITSRDAPALSMVYKLVAIDGAGRVKLSPGKRTYPLAKQVFRSRDADGRFAGDHVARWDEACDGEPLLSRVVSRGEWAGALPSMAEIRDHCRSQLSALPVSLRGTDAEGTYPVSYSEALEQAARGLGL